MDCVNKCASLPHVQEKSQPCKSVDLSTKVVASVLHLVLHACTTLCCDSVLVVCVCVCVRACVCACMHACLPYVPVLQQDPCGYFYNR